MFHDPKVLKELNRLIEAETAINLNSTIGALNQIMKQDPNFSDLKNVLKQCAEKAELIRSALLGVQQKRAEERLAQVGREK